MKLSNEEKGTSFPFWISLELVSLGIAIQYSSLITTTINSICALIFSLLMFNSYKNLLNRIKELERENENEKL